MPTSDQYIFEVEQHLKRRGLPEMDTDTLREVYKRMNHPEVMQAIQSGQLTTQGIADEVFNALQAMQTGKTEAATEGGFVNDQSGLATSSVRNQLGISP